MRAMDFLARRSGIGTGRFAARAVGAVLVALLLLPGCSEPDVREIRPDLAPIFRRLEEEEVQAAAAPESRGGDALFLASALLHAEPRVRERAARTVGRASPRGAATLLAERLPDEPLASVRREIAWALGRVEGADRVPALERAAEDPDPGVRAASADGLASAGEAGFPAVLGLLDDARARVRQAACLALARHPDVPVDGEELADIARGRSERAERVRWAAFAALLSRPDLVRRHERLIVDARSDSNRLVRWLANEAAVPEDTVPGGAESGGTVPGGAESGPDGSRSGGAERPSGEAGEDGTGREPPLPADGGPFARHRLDPGGSPEIAVDAAGWSRPHLLLDAAGRGDLVIALSRDLAPRHVRDLLRRVLAGEYRRARIERDGSGLEVEILPFAATPAPGPLPGEPSIAPIRWGTLLAGKEYEQTGRLRIALRPLVREEGRVTVLGRVRLGGRLLDSLRTGDRLSLEPHR